MGRRLTGSGGPGWPGPHPGSPGDAVAVARRRLERVVDDLRGELAAIAAATADGPDDEHDAEGSTLGYERARVGGLLQRAEDELDGLRIAAERLADGSYERCESCGRAIDPDRLAALPATRRCVSCAAVAGWPKGRVRARE